MVYRWKRLCFGGKRSRMSKEQKVTLKEWLYITIGILIMTVGIYFFKFPNHFSTGGVTGIAIVLGHYIPSITPGTLVTIINIGLLILGFAVFGRSFGIRTVYASLLMSGTLQLLEVILSHERPDDFTAAGGTVFRGRTSGGRLRHPV